MNFIFKYAHKMCQKLFVPKISTLQYDNYCAVIVTCMLNTSCCTSFVFVFFFVWGSILNIYKSHSFYIIFILYFLNIKIDDLQFVFLNSVIVNFRILSGGTQ